MPNKIADFLFVKTGVPKFQKYLDLTSVRHKLIGGNIANSSTPGYRSKDINFQDEFNKATGQEKSVKGFTTDNQHIPLGQHRNRPPKVDEIKVHEGDLNSVDIDKEISSLAQNELTFNIGARLIKMKFDGLRKAITSK
ncbi:MAG: flagellar basal body rod protein FlgB [candidate division Zixibacteria bacterium]|nr:flagellar basal body rod protein FlgB [candidate division Zixibacteria bacterium]